MIEGDAHAIYRRLRDESPVHRCERWKCWALSRFEDVWNACQSDAFSSASGTTTAHLLTKVQPVTPQLNAMDPPAHTSLRALLRKRFMPRRVRALEPLIAQTVHELLEPIGERGACEFVMDFAQPLATRVGCAVIGLPAEDGDRLRDWVDRFFAREPGTPGLTQDGLAALQEMGDYFERLSAERRRRPPAEPDAITALQSWQAPDGHRPDDAEVASNLFLLLVGGTDTLPKVLANLMLRLHREPRQRARVVADPALAVDAFNEAVRIDMPTQNMARRLLRDVELHGTTMRAGDPVLLLYASANRDEREFPDPEVYDILRRPPRTLSFSHGTHACIGLHVARKEGELALRELLRRFPDYEIEETGLERYRTEFVQGYARMPLRTGPRA